MVLIVGTPQGRQTAMAQTVLPKLRTIAVELGFGLEQVGVTGATMTGTADVLAKLQMSHAQTLLFFDVNAAARRIETLPWVAKAEMTRRFPGELHVEIQERVPFALWQMSNGLYLIDSQGRTLGRTNDRAAPNLPRVSGTGAAYEAGHLMTVLALYPDVVSRLRVAERIGGRRWRLMLKNGSAIDLPSGGEARALGTYASHPMLAGVIDQPDAIVDLRLHDRIVVRRTNGKTAVMRPIPGATGAHRGG
ncbi:MAG: FtsQ-type POTRA domain-containing protein [Pseudomonadota bacterium]